jgi:hypothetical protein
MAVPSPQELMQTFGCHTPEQLAWRLGFNIVRVATAPVLPGVLVASEYRPERAIVLYEDALRALATQRQEPLLRFEQWHIAHELYHGLAETQGLSAWRVRETAADVWADELLALSPPVE